jgi:hypothetical protein
VHVAPVEQAFPDAADFFAGERFVHPSSCKGFGEEVVGAEVAGLEGQVQGATFRDGMTPRHAGVDLRADLHLRDAQRLDARAGGLTASHHELAYAALDQAARDRGDAVLDHGAGRLHTELRLHRFHRAGLGRRIDQYRPARQQGRRPGQRRSRHIIACRQPQRIRPRRRGGRPR